MKKEKLSMLIMLLSIIFFSACSDKNDANESFTISVSPKTLTLKVGETAVLTVNDAPKNAQLTWKSANEKVAKVENGKVQGLEIGTTKIMVIAKKGDISSEAVCEVTVVEDENKAIAFTDPYLKQLLLEKVGADTNKDGQISIAEAKEVKILDFDYSVDDAVEEGKTIKSLEGLQYFTNLETLAVNYHHIADASPIYKLTNLKVLHIGANNIKTIDLSNFKELKDIRVFKNAELATLNLTNNTKLEIVDIHNTLISELDPTPLKELNTFVASHTQLKNIKFVDLPLLTGIDLKGSTLTSLEVSNLPKLEKLYIEQNQINSLKLSNLPELQHLVAYENKITKIDFELPKLMFLTINDNEISEANFSKMPMLFRCYISKNKLTKIDFTQNNIIGDIDLTYIPTLESIDLKNGAFMDNHEYALFYGNTNLKTIRVDKGDEETYVKGLAQNFKNVQIIAE
ncbi:Ig-like domain-containing protein [Prevotella disiens]|uniref:Ig-like domain-containing protein n=1 Tax=Prevotella disiens TaxID=28130 RepID=UPI00242F5E71|nr:Ig-like domain-containing protein [Prevotella disiens]